MSRLSARPRMEPHRPLRTQFTTLTGSWLSFYGTKHELFLCASPLLLPRLSERHLHSQRFTPERIRLVRQSVRKWAVLHKFFPNGSRL